MSRGARCAVASAALLCASLLCAARGVAGIRGSGIAGAAASERHAAAARLAAAEVALSAPLAAMVEAVGELLDSCGGSAAAVGALPTPAAAAAGEAPDTLLPRLAADVAEIDAALRRCHVVADGAANGDDIDDEPAGTRDRVLRPGVAHTAAASATLRQRLRDVERDAEALRERTRACASRGSDASPPPAGAAALYGWVRGARQAIETAPGCMLPEPVAACDCSRAVAAAVAATFCATAAAAAAVTAALLRSRQSVSAPRRRLRGAAVLGLGRATSASPKQQHAGEA